MNQQRRRDLKAHIQETLQLLKEYDDKRRLSDDPLEKRRCERRTAELRQLLDAYQIELSMMDQRDGASVARVLMASVTTGEGAPPVLEIEDDLAGEILAVLREIRDTTAGFTSLIEALKQQGITITGDGNIVGSNNQVIVVKGDAAQNAIRQISDVLCAGEIEFVNRENELYLLGVERLRASLSPYTLLSAPAGYGKSYLLRHLVDAVESDETLREKWHCCYVDCAPREEHEDQVAALVHVIAGLSLPDRSESDVSAGIVCDHIVQELSTPLPDGRRAVLLIFDGVERIDEQARWWLYALLHNLRTRTRAGYREIVTVRVIIAGRDVGSFWDGYAWTYPRPPAPQRVDLSPFGERPIQELLWSRARAVHVDLDDQTIVQMADELQYLSGGHPTVVRSLVDHLAGHSFAIGSPSEYFIRHREQLVRAVLSPVAEDLLDSLEVYLGPQTTRAVQALSVFRRVNANTVRALIEAGVLPVDIHEIALLGDMQRVHLLDGPGIREPFYRDHLLRRIWALNMAYGSDEGQAQYRRLNKVALDLYAGWIRNLGQGLPDTHLKATQRLLSVVEWLFHALQDEDTSEGELRAGLREHVRVLSERGQTLSVAELIAGEIRDDIEVCYLLRHRLGGEGVSIVCSWLQSA